jgi:crossover junction endodeoxyribonuclease RusA
VRLTLPYPPSANRYWRVDKRGFAYVSTEARAYKNRIRLLAMAERLRPLAGPVSLSLGVYRPQKSGDLSNRIKVLEDALSGVAFEDDDQVVELHALRMDDKTNPRVEVTIERWVPR